MSDDPLVVLRDRADYHYRRWHELSPPHGTIAIGGEHFDHYLKYHALSEFLRGVPSMGPVAACESAKRSSREVVQSWNRRREW